MRFVVFIFLSFFAVVALASDQTIRFQHLSLEDGLSQVSVEAILQDRQGFLWLGTHDGLNRYDGYQFKEFRHSAKDPHSLSNNHVSILFEDSAGRLWVGTDGGGLNRYDALKQRFTRFIHHPNDPHSISHDHISAIAEDEQGRLWVGTVGGGLNRYDPQYQRFIHYRQDWVNGNSLGDDGVTSLYADQQGKLWIGTQNTGLNQLDLQTGEFKYYRNDSADPQSISYDSISAIHPDDGGSFWVGTLGGGLNYFDKDSGVFSRLTGKSEQRDSLSNTYIRTICTGSESDLWIGTDSGLVKLDLKTQRFDHYRHDPSDPNSISEDTVFSLFMNDKGVLWIGTFAGGLNKVLTRQRHFGHYQHQVSAPNSLSHNTIISILVDSQQTLWLGTLGGGLNKMAQGGMGFEHFRFDEEDNTSLSHDNVWALLEDSKQRLWVGTYGGLNLYDRENNQFEHFSYQSQDATSLSNNWVSKIYEDHDNNLWVATRGGGLNLFDPQNKTFTRFKHDSSDLNSLSSDLVMSILEDGDGVFWIATFGGGVNKFDHKTGRFVRYFHQPDDPSSLGSDQVLSIFKDSLGSLWFGTYGGGLNQFNPVTNHFKVYREGDGLVNDTVYGILEDNHKNLWLSTNKGISKFNLQSKKFEHYSAKDGLQSDEFNSAYFLAADGEMFFGGVNGFNRFYPEHIQRDQKPPKVAFTDFMLANQTVPIATESQIQGQEFLLPGAIDQLQQLTLGYQQNLVTFEFAAMDHAAPKLNRYQYRLEGLDDNWVNSDARIRRATYTNLPSGNYILRIRAANSDGFWNEQGAAIRLKVTPPPWRTWWAWLSYVSLIVFMVLSLIRAERKKVQHERKVNLQLKQVDKLKDEFLANTSHELRTPLNGIIGLAESLMDGATGELPQSTKANLAMVVASGKRLANLVNDILDFSKLKNSKLELDCKAVELHCMADVVLTLSKPLLGDKKLQLINNIGEGLPAVKADEDRLAQIFHNLVGNAIKFTDEGQIALSAQVSGGFIELRVTDTGIGIAEDQLSAIFGSFEQLKGDDQRVYGGTGLGLSVSKQLIELHGGTIGVKSSLGEGSEFIFTLPISSDEPTATIDAGQMIARLHMLEDAPIPNQQAHNSDGRFRILLVDDEPINRQVLFNHLSLRNYQLVEAADGAEALLQIKENGPFDLVLLDIMMPRLSGYEVCQELREKYPVNDLPVIFLTAKNQVADLVQSFAVGANDYVSKPVSKYELLTRVETHLKLLDINRNLERKVAERTAELEQSNQTITTLSEISTEITATLDLTVLVNRVYNHIRQLMDVDVFAIGLYDAEEQNIKFKLAIEDEQSIPPVHISMDEQTHPAVWCVEQQQPLVINDLARDFSRYFGDLAIPLPKVGKTRESIIYWPLIVGDKLVGTLTVQSYRKMAYNEAIQDMIHTLSATTAIALDNANAYAEVEKKNRLVEQQKIEVEIKNKAIVSTQQQLVHAEKMASLGTLTAGVAHEINNPTNFIDVSAQNLNIDLQKLEHFILALADDDADEEVLDNLRQRFEPLYQHLITVKDGSERIKTIVQDLRIFSQLDAAAKKTIVITDCLRATLNLVRTKNNNIAHFKTEFKAAPELLCYPAQLNQVFMNLIVNACEAIRAKMTQQQQGIPGNILVGCQLIDEANAKRVEITIKDDGIGMDEQTKNKLFEPFYTTKDVGEGTGLGLSIAYGIVQKHNGDLRVESELGRGTLFRLTLPLD